MRVHELDEAYGLSKDDVKTVLTLAGLSTHHLSNMDEEELKSFEIALELFREDTEGEAPADEEDELPGLLDDFESALKGEPSPLLSDEDMEEAVAHYEAQDDEEPLPVIEGAVGEEELEEIRGDGPFVLSSPDEDAFELMPEADVFPCVNDRGAFTENCLLPPDLAEKVRAILGGNRINSYLLDLDRGEFVFVVWEEARKYSVRIDEDE